jgi:hypothetical protein
LNWQSAEAALRAYVEAGWAGSIYSTVPLVWENTLDDPADLFVSLAIEGTYADKTVFGNPGKRNSIEAGVLFFHAFTPIGSGKSAALSLVETMTQLLELRAVAPGVNLDGGNPPTPVESRAMTDRALPIPQPHGNYYRCSGSIPFIVLDVR